jgi:hypothetical protein
MKPPQHPDWCIIPAVAMVEKYRLLYDPNPARLADRINDLAVQGYVVEALYATHGLGVKIPEPEPGSERRAKYRAPEEHDTHFAWMVHATAPAAIAPPVDLKDDAVLRAHAEDLIEELDSRGMIISVAMKHLVAYVNDPKRKK